MDTALRFGPLGDDTIHLCVDMQMVFAEKTDWHVPWLSRVLPTVAEIAEAHPEKTVFTRFVPPANPEAAAGAWRRYYERWRHMTRDCLKPELIELMPRLSALVPPATVIDKQFYSPFADETFSELIRQRRPSSVVITGAETDVCVLATVLDAVDAGLRVIVVEDAVCSVSDPSHDALLQQFAARFSQQIEVAPARDILAHWH